MTRDTCAANPPSDARDIETLLLRALSLAGLPAERITALAWELMPASYSSAQLARAHLAVRAPGCAAAWHTRLVVKQIAAREGWLGWASEDAQVREVQLWRMGVFDRLPRGLASAAQLAAHRLAPDGSVRAGTLVMRDVSAHLLPNPLQAPRLEAPVVPLLLDALARLHAAFWEDRTLLDPRLGLMPVSAALGFAAPDTVGARLAMGDSAPYLQAIPSSWDAYFAAISVHASAVLRSALADRAPYAAAMSSLPFTLVHGDTWGPNIALVPGARHPHAAPVVVLLDWGLASAAPCTFDPLWLAATWPALDPMRVMAHYRARLTLHLRSHGRRLTPWTWLRLLDAGYLRTVMAGGEAFGHALQEARTPNEERSARAIATWWATRAATAAERLRTN